MPERAPGSREEDAWLSDAQLTKCTPADEAEGFDSPIPTQMVSNGEYMPYPQTDKQRQVEARIKDLADSASKKLGISRRKFLAGTGGMAAALLAMNEVFGRFFDVRPIDMFESEAFAASGPPQNLFVLDDQTHMVRFTQTQGRSLRAIAQGPGPASTAAGFLRNPNNSTGALDELGNAWTPWNPLLGQTPNTGSEFHLAKYIQRFFLESQVTVSILSNANLGSIPVAGEPNRPPKTIAESLGAENLTGHMTAGVRDFVNQIAGSTRMLAHGQLYPGVGNLHDPVYGDYTQWQIDTFHPDSWKGYNIATAAKLDFNSESAMARWRLDDELVAYPIYEVIARNKQELKKHPGFWNICVHKGLAPGPPDVPERGNPTDIPKAAGDWPQFNFIIYHSCIRNGFFDLDSLETIRSGPTRVVQGAEVPDISWTTQFAELSAPFRNVYAELGAAVQAAWGERGVGPRGVQTRASELRVADPQFAADAPRVSGRCQRQLFEDEEAVRRDGRRAQQYPLRLAPNESVARNPAHRAGREALRRHSPHEFLGGCDANLGGSDAPGGYARRQRPRPASRASRWSFRNTSW